MISDDVGVYEKRLAFDSKFANLEFSEFIPKKYFEPVHETSDDSALLLLSSGKLARFS